VGEAVDNGIPVIPLRIEDVEPSQEMRYYIKSIHWLDAMTPPLEQHLEKLVDSVQALLSVGAEEQPPSVVETELEAPEKKRWPLPIWATTLIALVVVVIVGGVGWIAIPQSRSTPTPSAVSPASVSIIPELTDTPAAEVPTATSPASVSIIPELTDTPTAEVPTATSAAVTSILFRDDFDNALAEGWNIVREVSSHWSLTEKPGAWRITLQAGAIGDAIPEPPTNLLLHEAPSSDFEIATLVHFTPVSNVQFAGLIVYQDDLNAVQFGRAYCDLSEMCVGNGIYFDNTSDISKNFATVTSNPSIAYLRLRREGTTYTGYFSEDGESWIIIGQHISNITPLQVGLTAGQVLEGETIADFEYFTMETLPTPSSGWSDWRTLSFLIPNPQIWEESGDNRYTAIEQHDADAFAWSTETFEGDLMVSLDLERPEIQSDGCVIIYGDGREHSYGSLIFCVDWDGFGLEKHTKYHEGENSLTFNFGDNNSDKVYSIIIEIIDDIASMYVNGEKVLSSFFHTEEIDRSGRVGLFRNWAVGEITFSNIQIKTRSSEE
jgi:regulation of enolase protein 1 (concanavalin A-like superfamily)